MEDDDLFDDDFAAQPATISPEPPTLPGPHVDFDALLGTPPATISDCFSSVLGDSFHYMDRPKIPTNHEYKKKHTRSRCVMRGLRLNQ